MPRRAHDLALTLAAWMYFTGAFVAGFWLLYALACLRRNRLRRMFAFQRLNHWYYRGFFALIRVLAPARQWRIDERLGESRGRVILCNHLSYLDPLLMMAALPHGLTLVKPVFFRFPIFGRVLKRAGYIPAGGDPGLMLDQMAGLKACLEAGGNFFLFPEGTRSRTGALMPLQPGALKLARQSGAELAVFRIKGTGTLFPPGRFLFNAAGGEISIRLVGRVKPDDPLYHGPLAELAGHIAKLLAAEDRASKVQSCENI